MKWSSQVLRPKRVERTLRSLIDLKNFVVNGIEYLRFQEKFERNLKHGKIVLNFCF